MQPLTKEEVEKWHGTEPHAYQARERVLALLADRDRAVEDVFLRLEDITRLREALAEATAAGSEIAGFFENSNRAESKGGHQYTTVFMWALVAPQLDRIEAAARAALGEP